MRVLLRPQQRTIELQGRRAVGRLLEELQVVPGTVMVIRGNELLNDRQFVEDTDEIEIRGVISGGAS